MDKFIIFVVMEEKSKHPGGRPQKTFAQAKEILGDNWDEIILSQYKEGGNDIDCRGYLAEKLGTFSQALWDRWMIEEEEFSITVKTGRAISAAWYSKKFREHAELPSKEKNTASLIYIAKNAHPDDLKDAREKQHRDVTPEKKPNLSALTDAELEKYIELQKKIQDATKSE